MRFYNPFSLMPPAYLLLYPLSRSQNAAHRHRHTFWHDGNGLARIYGKEEGREGRRISQVILVLVLLLSSFPERTKPCFTSNRSGGGAQNETLVLSP